MLLLVRKETPDFSAFLALVCSLLPLLPKEETTLTDKVIDLL